MFGLSSNTVVIEGCADCNACMFGVVEKDEGQYDEPIPVFWATGAALFVRTQVYREVGGLDARFFAHQEEIDLCWRLRARGRSIVCVPQSVVFHVGGGTLPTGSPRKNYLNFRNNLLLLYKNLPERDLRPVLRLRRWLDLVAALKELLTGHWQNFRAIRRARRDFRKLRPEYEAVRADNLRRATTDLIPERTAFSLLWQYYFRRRTTYDRLPR